MIVAGGAGPQRRPRSAARLSFEEMAVLLCEVAPFIRTHTLYLLAFRLGLHAAQLSRLDIGDVSEDGSDVGKVLRLRACNRAAGGTRFRLIRPDLQGPLGRYLSWRRHCSHWRLPLQTYRDYRGVERCHACREPVDFRVCPLFISRRRSRLSARSMREEFGLIRDRLRLDPALSFGSLRATARGFRGADGCERP